MTTKSVTEYMALPYSRVLVPDEGGGYFAQVLEFPGCFADGDTADQAMRRLDESMEAWIEVLLESGKPIPEPLALQGYSGRLALRLPKGVHKQAAQRAEADRVSLNQWIVEAIAERLGAERYTDRLLDRVPSLYTIQIAALPWMPNLPVTYGGTTVQNLNATTFRIPIPEEEWQIIQPKRQEPVRSAV